MQYFTLLWTLKKILLTPNITVIDVYVNICKHTVGYVSIFNLKFKYHFKTLYTTVWELNFNFLPSKICSQKKFWGRVCMPIEQLVLLITIYFALLLIYKSNAMPHIFQKNGSMQLWIGRCVLAKSVNSLKLSQVSAATHKSACCKVKWFSLYGNKNNYVLFGTNVFLFVFFYYNFTKISS